MGGTLRPGMMQPPLQVFAPGARAQRVPLLVRCACIDRLRIIADALGVKAPEPEPEERVLRRFATPYNADPAAPV